MSDKKQKKPAPKQNISEAKYGVKNKTKPKKVYVPGLELDLGKYTPHPDKKPFNDNKGFKKNYSKLDPESQSLIDMVLDPESAESTVRWPNTYGLSSTYKSVNVINANFDAAGESVVLVYPKLSNSIFATAGGDFDFNVTKPTTLANTAPNNYLNQKLEFGSNTNLQENITAPFFFENNHAVLPVPQYVNNSVSYLYPITARALPASGITSPFINFTFDNLNLQNNVGALTVSIQLYAANFGNVGGALQGVVGAFNDVNIRCCDLVSQASFMSFRIIYNGNHGYEGNVTMNIRQSGDAAAPATFPFRLPHFYTHCLVSDLNASKQISTTAEKYIVTAQSLLVSWRGSTLNNAGLICSARIPSGTNAIGSKTDLSIAQDTGGNAYFSWLASLPNNKCDNALKDGTYSWYLGDDESDYFYKSTEDQDLDLPYLCAAFNTTVATAANTVKIKIVTHVQFKSNAQIYAQLPSSYMKNSDMLVHVLSLINSSYCNDEHKKGLKEQLIHYGKQVGKVLVNPKTYLTIAEIMTLLGL